MRKPAGNGTKPNILFMLTDNVGYGVPSCFNGGILDTPTPRIDKLAAEGLRLTNFNIENQCTPSRAALMTGRLPIRSGIGKAIAAGAPGGLHPWEITLAEMLGDAGYRTAMLGKWHLGTGTGRLPTDQGFDEWFGFETTDVSYWTGNPGMPVKDVDHIREAKKGEKPRNVRAYDQDTRRQIDRMLTDRAVDYVTKNGKADRPFFLYVGFAFAHHPVLAHPDFKGMSPAGEFGDSLLEHDHDVGRILDALTAVGLDDDTVVVWTSDNGPSPLPTVTPYWTIGDSGPWRDLFPTLAGITGGKAPADRPIDGVDQLDFFTGRQERSNREHVLLFLGQKLMAVKWRNYKMHLDGLDRVDGVFEDWSFPRAFNLASDPKERWNIIWQNTWVGEEIGPFVAAYQSSVKRYPNLAAGQPNDSPPRYGREDPAAETGAEEVDRKLGSLKEH
jgi:arylsulfatase